MKIRMLLLSLLTSAGLFAQHVVMPSTGYPLLDQAMTGILGSNSGTVNPALCMMGHDLFYNTLSGVQFCSATNVWSPLSSLLGSGTSTRYYPWGGAVQSSSTGVGLSLPASNAMLLTNCVTEALCSATVGSTIKPWIAADAGQSAEYASIDIVLPTGYVSNSAITWTVTYTMSNTTGTPKLVFKWSCGASGALLDNPTYTSVSSATLPLPSSALHYPIATGTFSPTCSAGSILSIIIQPDSTTGPMTSKLFFDPSLSYFSLVGGS